MRIKLDTGAYKPTRAHPTDAGLDLYSTVRTIVAPLSSVIIDTGVHIELPPGTVGLIKSKSGLMTKHGITSDGTIDEDYRGSIRVMLFNHSRDFYMVEKGDKISQLVILPVLRPDVELVEHLTDTERGENGFGSSGR